MPYRMIVARIWELYAWPEGMLPMRRMTADKLRRYPVQAAYVSDDARTVRQPPRAWDYGRIRFFYDELRAGRALDPIQMDNVCEGGRIYPEPALNDGHHRLAASHLAGATHILVDYGGRMDLCRYLTGHRKTCPAS
jgi:hypothetical protein